jgi:hypothetical protein
MTLDFRSNMHIVLKIFQPVSKHYTYSLWGLMPLGWEGWKPLYGSSVGQCVRIEGVIAQNREMGCYSG